MPKISIVQVRRLINKLHGRFFTVVFKKRTDGSRRVMTCRRGVSKYRTGEGAKFSFRRKGLIPVFDIQKKAYRCFPVDGIREIRANGSVYRLKAEAR